MILVLDVVIGLLACVGLALLALTIRRMVLTRGVGTFACSLRRGEHADGDGWSYGIGRYHGDRVEWFAVFSLSPRPRHVLTRKLLVVRSRRAPDPAEVHAIATGSMVMQGSFAGDQLELAMSPESMTGFMSWVEAAPPRDPMAA